MATQEKHTPGPWEAYLPGRKFVIPARNFKAVCELLEHDRSPEMVDANARLIAAAPDLLAAVRAFVNACRRPSKHYLVVMHDAAEALLDAVEPILARLDTPAPEQQP